MTLQDQPPPPPRGWGAPVGAALDSVLETPAYAEGRPVGLVDPSAAGTFIPYNWVSPTPDPPVRRRRWVRNTVSLLVVVLLVAGGGLGWLAWRNDRNAHAWRNLALSRSAQLADLTAQMRLANSRIHTLDSQLGTLGGQVTSLQQQLGSVANQKEKAVDKETVLQQLLTTAGQVADDLQQCVSATNQFDTDLNSAVASGDAGAYSQLENEAARVTTTCGTAESANQQLQAEIQSAP